MTRAGHQALRLLAPPSLVYATAAAATMLLTKASSWLMQAAAVLIGLILWTLAEYWVHRLIQHAPPHRWYARLDDHAYHHHRPEDLREFVYTLPQSLLFMAPLGILAFSWGGLLGPGLWLWSGFALGYVLYEWVHMLAHCPELAGGRPWLIAWASNHRKHHWQNGRKHFGFVTAVWDRLFGTN